MLNEVRSDHLGAFLNAAQVTIAASPTVNISKDDFTITRPGAGRAVIVAKDIFNRLPVAVGTLASAPAGGSSAFNSTTLPTTSTFEINAQDSSGGAVDGTLDFLTLGYRKADTDLFKNESFAVKTSRANTRMIPCVISAAGVVTLGAGAVTCVKNSTGDYTVTFRRSFCGVPTVHGSAFLGMINTSSKTASSVNVKTYTTGAVAADCAFNLIIVGWDTIETVGRKEKPLMSHLRAGRLIGLSMTTPASPVITVGGATGGVDATVVRNGTGNHTFTLTRPFARIPAVVGVSANTRFFKINSVTSSTIQIFAQSGGGSGTDQELNLIICGDDSTDELFTG